LRKITWKNSSAEARFSASLQTGYFIDIGIPETFNKAQTDLARPAFRPDSYSIKPGPIS
jgi:hypothetical protein